MTLTVACVLHVPTNRRADYDAEYVERLKTGVERHLAMSYRFVCLSNVDVPCERIPLQYGWTGWWAKLELFRLDGKILFFDLDTVIVGDITPLANQDRFTVIAGWDSDKLRRHGRYRGNGSGVMLIPDSTIKREIWDTASADPHRVVSSYNGDGEFIVPYAQTSWMEVLPGHLVSYKKHVMGKGLPDDARVVCFHGRPRPRDVKEDWMERGGW